MYKKTTQNNLNLNYYNSNFNIFIYALNIRVGGQKCLYAITDQSGMQIKGTHTTPVKHYVDDLTFEFQAKGKDCIGSVSLYYSSTSYIYIYILNINNRIQFKRAIQQVNYGMPCLTLAPTIAT